MHDTGGVYMHNESGCVINYKMREKNSGGYFKSTGWWDQAVNDKGTATLLCPLVVKIQQLCGTTWAKKNPFPTSYLGRKGKQVKY